MKAERDFIVSALQAAGVKGTIHESIKSLKNCSEVHVGAVIRVSEQFARSNSKRRYGDQQGFRVQRNRLFERITTLHVIIGDAKEEKVEGVLDAFLKRIERGFEVDGNWVVIEIGDADWMEGQDSILKSKIIVEFDVILHGGIYSEHEIKAVGLGDITPAIAEEEV